jgi:hypothetical protein
MGPLSFTELFVHRFSSLKLSFFTILAAKGRCSSPHKRLSHSLASSPYKRLSHSLASSPYKRLASSI